MEPVKEKVQQFVLHQTPQTSSQHLERLHTMTVGRTNPMGVHGRAYVTTALIVEDGLTSREASAQQNQHEALKKYNISTGPRHKTPNIVATGWYRLRFRFLDDPESREEECRFEYDVTGSKFNLSFGDTGSVLESNTYRARFMDMHPQLSDSPVHWSPEKQKKYRVSIQCDMGSPIVFRWAGSKPSDVSANGGSDIDSLAIGLRAMIYPSSLDAKEVLASALGHGATILQMKSAGTKATTLADNVMHLIEREITSNTKLVAQKVMGEFPAMVLLCQKAEKLGIIRFDASEAHIISTGKPDSEDAVYEAVPDFDIPHGTLPADHHIVFAQHIYGNSGHNAQMLPALYQTLRAKCDEHGLSHAEAKSDRVVAEKAIEALTDEDYLKWIKERVSVGDIVENSEGAYFGNNKDRAVCQWSFQQKANPDKTTLIWNKTKANLKAITLQNYENFKNGADHVK